MQKSEEVNGFGERTREMMKEEDSRKKNLKHILHQVSRKKGNAC